MYPCQYPGLTLFCGFPSCCQLGKLDGRGDQSDTENVPTWAQVVTMELERSLSRGMQPCAQRPSGVSVNSCLWLGGPESGETLSMCGYPCSLASCSGSWQPKPGLVLLSASVPRTNEPHHTSGVPTTSHADVNWLRSRHLSLEEKGKYPSYHHLQQQKQSLTF